MATKKELEKLSQHRYGQWAGHPKGFAYKPDQCAKTVHDNRSMISYQCSRKNGHGDSEKFCKQHSNYKVKDIIKW